MTLSDVAREAGVSLATASRVVNGSQRRVAPDLHARVLATAERLGYTADIAAQTTARGTSPTIALLVADIADPFFGLIAAGVARGADEEGLIVTIGVTGREAAREVELMRTLRGQRPRGVILVSSRTAGEDSGLQLELERLTAMGTRVVGFGRVGDRAVSIDNRGGGRALGERMAALGYRRAIALAAAEGVHTSDDRLAGFTEGFGAGGGDVERVYRGDFSRESGAAMMARAMDERIADGALVAGVSDVVAIGAMTAARDAGLTVGERVAFCGFDDIPLSHDVSPGLTTVHVPLEEIGYQAFRLTLHDEAPSEPRLEVILRGSTPGRR